MEEGVLIFLGITIGLSMLCSITLHFYLWRKENKKVFQPPPDFKKFQKHYLTVYALATLTEWLQLQIPFFYGIYQSYGFSKVEITGLFITWFSSSAIFGTFVGSLGDKYGRRRLCLLYSVVYSLSTILMVGQNIVVQVFSRILAGIATSLLHTNFEAWMVNEHIQQSYPHEWLSNTFCYGTMIQAILAILSCVVSRVVAMWLGEMGPFFLSLVVSVVLTVVIYFQWSENYGNVEMKFLNIFGGVLSTFRNEKSLILLGLSQSTFGATIYLLLFASKNQEQWTSMVPALGFTSMWVCVTIGVGLNRILLQYLFSTEAIYKIILLVSSFTMVAATFVENFYVNYLSFILFGICCGVHLPCSATLRGQYLMEENRSAIMNFFRVPLNLLVVAVLCGMNSLSQSSIYLICAVWLLIGTILQHILSRQRKGTIVVISGDSNWAIN